MTVIYRPVPGYDDLYAGMDASIVKAGVGELERKIHPHKGYAVVYIPDVGPREVHQLVALAYLGPKPPGIHVRHGDHDKLNPSVGNLCYGTPQQNTRDSIANGTHGSVTNALKNECPEGHQYTSDNTYIHPRTGYRQCRKCRAKHAKIAETKRDKAAQMREYRARLRRADSSP